jgi:SpoIID/LytB domain protein
MSQPTQGSPSPRRARALVVVAVAAAITAGGPAAIAADTFKFHGSGYGHGIGMSQWGAYGLASQGWTYREILTHFYRHTEVEAIGVPKQIRVGLTSGRTRIHLGARNGPVELWIDGPGDRFVVKIPRGDDWTVARTRTRSAYAIRNEAGKLVGGRRWGGPASPLFATFSDPGTRVFVPEADDLWHHGFSYAYGFLEFDLTGCASRCTLRLTNQLPLERYLRGLGEMPSSWPAGALRAQAVAARTFATWRVRRSGIRISCDCHVSDGAGDQVYVGYSKEVGPDGDRWVAAVDDTAGEVVTYRGSVIQAFYAASDGGHSENVEDVWHGGNSAFAIPYLRGVCDPGEYTAANPWTDWTRTYSAGTVTQRLGPYTGSIGTIRRFTDVRRGESGRIISAVARGSNGSAGVSGPELRSALGLPDGRVWINEDRNIVGAIRAKYDGLMCRPGLPTSGIATLDHGSRQLFATGGIYRNGAVDLTVWLKGTIHREYLAVGGARGRLGLPVSGAVEVSGQNGPETCRSCRRLVLEGGRIYFKEGAGAHALWGAVLSTYLDNGGASGTLGYPTTRVRVDDDGVRRARFEHGTIKCSNGACEVLVG